MTEEEFLRSRDFLKIGQAITHKNKQVAVMAIKRLSEASVKAGVEGFERNFSSLRSLVIAGNYKEALDVLTVVTNKRVKLLKKYEITE